MLAKALEVWNLTLQPLDAPEMQCTAQHPEEEDAFICNLQASAIPLLHVLFSNCQCYTGPYKAIGAVQILSFAVCCYSVTFIAYKMAF